MSSEQCQGQAGTELGNIIVTAGDISNMVVVPLSGHIVSLAILCCITTRILYYEHCCNIVCILVTLLFYIVTVS